MSQRQDIGPGGPAGNRHVIGGQPPSGIKRRAQTGHRAAAQQRLEPQRAGHGPDRINARHCGDHIGAGQDDIGIFGGVRHCTPAQPCLDIGMWFIQDHRARIGGTGGGEQCQIAGNRAGARHYRRIILDLSGHQYPVAVWQTARQTCASQIVF